MLSFVLCDSDIKRREIYINVIKRFLYASEDYYTIYEFDKFGPKMQESLEHIEGVKIYLINIDEEDMSGILLAKKIRCKGDFLSPILILTSKGRKCVVDKLRNILYLDIIEIGSKLVDEMLQSLVQAYKIVTRHEAYTFISFDEVYRLPYDDIYYVQKNLNDDSVTIYTKDDTYLNYITIKGVSEQLESDPRFFKVHRSCIINLYKVASFDRKSNTVVFNNGMQINLVSRYNKSRLIDRLRDYSDKKCKKVI